MSLVLVLKMIYPHHNIFLNAKILYLHSLIFLLVCFVLDCMVWYMVWYMVWHWMVWCGMVWYIILQHCYTIPILGSNGSFPKNGTIISVANCSAPPVVAGNIWDVFCGRNLGSWMTQFSPDMECMITYCHLKGSYTPCILGRQNHSCSLQFQL